MLGEPHGKSVTIEIAFAFNVELDLNLYRLSIAISEHDGSHCRPSLTSQFVAVNGTLENNHPARDALSGVSRTYLGVAINQFRPVIWRHDFGTILICSYNLYYAALAMRRGRFRY